MEWHYCGACRRRFYPSPESAAGGRVTCPVCQLEALPLDEDPIAVEPEPAAS